MAAITLPGCYYLRNVIFNLLIYRFCFFNSTNCTAIEFTLLYYMIG